MIRSPRAYAATRSVTLRHEANMIASVRDQDLSTPHAYPPAQIAAGLDASPDFTADEVPEQLHGQ
ncbi:hypothetical protein Xph01_56980 [Micromonospora phaseoli]|nr:hypothetical protein Xph01_56980 [Micromonospora phaseoli]